MRIKKSCITCGDRVEGRSDKKYCSDECRSNHNNFQNRERNNLMRNINRALRRNHQILEKMSLGDCKIVEREKLLNLGYNFSYFTHIIRSPSGHESRFCYEHGIIAKDQEGFVIVNKESIHSFYPPQELSSAKVVSLGRAAISR